MKKILLLIVYVGFQLSSTAQTTFLKLDEYFKEAQKADLFNGSVLIAQKDISLEKGYGFKNLDDNASCDANTIYQIGSVTKQFTATIILKLAELGKLSLHDKLSKYFPEYGRANKITIENLLTHTSGIWNYTNDAAFMVSRILRPLSMDSMLLLIKDKPLEFVPGTAFSYSNSGYMLLGYIIEKASGKKYEQMVWQYIFQPLKMTHSGFDFIRLQSPDKAVGYNSFYAGKGEKSKLVDSSVSFAAGALYTTVGDLYKWNLSLGTQKILKRSSLQNAFTPRLSNYGFGFNIDTIYGKQRIAHSGGINGFLSMNTIIPTDSISITLLSNSNSSKMDKVNKDVLAILYNKPYDLPQEKSEVKIKPIILQQYVGEYELAPTFKITVTLVDNGLKAQATGQPQFDLYAKSEDKFFLKVVDAQVDFVKNDKGEVYQMILHQNGREVPGKKIK